MSLSVDSPLLIVLRARNLLRESEEALLRSPEVLALEPPAQLAYLKQNRSVGFFVTLFGGGIRVLILAGALVSFVGLALAGTIPFSWWMPPLWLALGAFVVWAVNGLLRSARALRAKLPDYEALRADIESKPT